MPKDPTEITFVEPATTRALADWTPGLLKAARVMADAGHLELAADFCESAMGDDRVIAALSTRTKGLVALPLTFEAAKNSKRVVRALEAGEDWWAAFPASALAQLLAWGIILGVGLGEIVWTDRGSTINRLVPVLKVWHPRHLRYDWQRRVWTLRTEDKTIDIRPGDGKWILYTPYGESRPWSFGAWRAISLWHLLKRYAIEDWGYYSGKNAGGHLVAVPVGEGKVLTKEARKELAADLFAAQANSAIVPPNGFTIEMVEATASTWETFEAQKNAADLGISVTLLGQNLSTEVAGRASTGATLQGRVLQVFVDADAETLSTCIHDQALTWWAEFNFGNRDLAPWPLWDTKPPDDKAEQANLLNTLSQAVNVLGNAGAPIDVRALLEKFGVPLRSVKDKEVDQAGQIFKYHLDYAVLTTNEIRARLGLPPIDGGDVPPKPVAAPASPDAPTDDTTDDDDKAAESVITRAGRTVRADSGLVAGQAYADTLATSARDRATDVLDEDLVAALEAVEAGESFDDVRERLVKVYRGMSADKLTRLTEAAITMAELGGRHALNEDL
jgi:phage gp29-like protein